MEGIVAKQAAGLYTPEATTWVKIQEPRLQPGGGAGGLLRPPESTVNGTKIRPVERASRPEWREVSLAWQPRTFSWISPNKF
jgi:hypothetical protein